MADQEVRSPNSVTRDTPHPRRNETGQMHGGPFSERADSGAPWKPRADQNAPVQGQPLGVMQDRGRRP